MHQRTPSTHQLWRDALVDLLDDPVAHVLGVELSLGVGERHLVVETLLHRRVHVLQPLAVLGLQLQVHVLLVTAHNSTVTSRQHTSTFMCAT